MASRMEKYNEKVISEGRTNKNRQLYHDMYSDANYTDINDYKQSDIAKSVSIEEIRNMLQKREEVKEEEPIINIITDEEKTYDINDVLSKAKGTEPDYKRRSIDNSKYEYLNKNKTLQEEQQEVEQLINTISTNSLVNKELAVDLLQDLKSNTMIGKNNQAIDEILQDVKDKTREIDTSFYTKSLSSNDFMGVGEEEQPKKSNAVVKILLALVVIAVIAGIIYLIQLTE